MKTILNKYKEIILYIVVGALTTLINLIIFVFARNLNIELISANTMAFIGAVLFAYIANNKIVFKANKKVKLKEEIFKFIKFSSLRVGSFLLETILLLILVPIISYELICKLIISFLVIILNYIISKRIIFK